MEGVHVMHSMVYERRMAECSEQSGIFVLFERLTAGVMVGWAVS